MTFYVHYDGQWHTVGTDIDGMDGWAVYWDVSQVADQVVQVKAFAGDFAGNGVETAIIGNVMLDRQHPPIVTATTPTTDTTPTWTWTTGGGGNGTFRYRLDIPVLTTGATTTTLKSFTPATALANGNHTLYVQERNAAGLWSATGAKTVLIDTVLPVNGTVTATPGPGQNTLSWSGFSDALSGIGGYKVVYATRAAPASCSVGTAIYNGTGTSYIHTTPINQIYYYRVCALDKAGNMSTGITKSAKPL